MYWHYSYVWTRKFRCVEWAWDQQNVKTWSVVFRIISRFEYLSFYISCQQQFISRTKTTTSILFIVFIKTICVLTYWSCEQRTLTPRKARAHKYVHENRDDNLFIYLTHLSYEILISCYMYTLIISALFAIATSKLVLSHIHLSALDYMQNAYYISDQLTYVLHLSA